MDGLGWHGVGGGINGYVWAHGVGWSGAAGHEAWPMVWEGVWCRGYELEASWRVILAESYLLVGGPGHLLHHIGLLIQLAGLMVALGGHVINPLLLWRFQRSIKQF